MNKTLQLNDVSLSYREWGDNGPAVLCLPSFAGHKGGFEVLANHLSPNYRVIAVDLRGRGDSSSPEEGYGLAYHCRDLVALTEHLGIREFAIVGHSFGATVGTYLASVRPELVSALVMLEGGADPTEQVLQAIRPMLDELEHSYSSVEQYLDARRALPFYRQQWNPMLEQYLLQDVYTADDGLVRHKASAQGLHIDLDLHFHYSMCLHFPAVQCPSLFVKAELGLLSNERGHIFTDAEVDAIVHWMQKGKRLDLPGVNHFTMLLNEEGLLNQPVREFLAQALC